MTAVRPAPAPLVIGWMERLDLPDLALSDVKAKIDTGARTSAIHAVDVEPFRRDEADWVRFAVPLTEADPHHMVEAPVHDRRDIKNTSGIPETRIVIRTRLRLIDRTWRISLSLADRGNMLFPMIVGRTALKAHDVAVHTRRAYLAEPGRR